MSGSISINTEQHAPPIVHQVAGTLRQAVNRHGASLLIRLAKGACVLESTEDPQHLSLHFARGKVQVNSGISKPASLIVKINWLKIDEPGYRPRVKGAWRHPLLALCLLAVLRPRFLHQRQGDWIHAAERFWAVASRIDYGPDQMVVHCPEESRTITLGEGAASVLIESSPAALNQLFNGQMVLLLGLFHRKLKAKGSLQHLTALSDAGLSLLLGEETPGNQPSMALPGQQPDDTSGASEAVDAGKALPGQQPEQPITTSAEVNAWLDQHQVKLVRTQVTNLDGVSLGKFLRRDKFLKAVPEGHGISDIALGMDTAGMPHASFWHSFRSHTYGDIMVKPDLGTLIPDGNVPGLGHVLCDFTSLEGEPIAICPRTMLRQMVNKIAAAGYSVIATFELEFFLFNTSFAAARQQQYQQLQTLGATSKELIYSLRSANHTSPFMQEALRRFTAQGINWESWNYESGNSQLEVNLVPTDPLAAADQLVRVRQILHEVALAMDMSVTFMAQVKPGYSSGLHIHHSLTDLASNQPAFYQDAASTSKQEAASASQEEASCSPLLQHWIAGLLSTAPAATSFLCPTVNSFRRIRDFTAVPVKPSWAVEDKSALLRVVTRSPQLARVEHRLAASDANPYLALAVILAGGLAGIQQQLTPPAASVNLGWWQPDDESQRLPTSILAAGDALAADKLLPEILGPDVVDYWRKSRRWDWFRFHADGGDPSARKTTAWEFENYFEII